MKMKILSMPFSQMIKKLQVLKDNIAQATNRILKVVIFLSQNALVSSISNSWYLSKTKFQLP